METELRLCIVPEKPPTGVDFGLQKGKGSDYETIQKQRDKGNGLSFQFTVTVTESRTDGLPNFLGPFTQGPPTERFIYIDIGRLAGQKETPWERRIKVPLTGITWEMIRKVSEDPNLVIAARIPGTGRDGGPSCGTVRAIGGWKPRAL